MDSGGSRQRQVLPGVAGKLQLKYSPFVGMEKIIALGDAVRVLGTYRAAFPPSRPDASAMLAGFFHQMDSVFHSVLEPSRPYRDQSPSPFALLCHNRYDATAHAKVTRFCAMSFHMALNVENKPVIIGHSRRKIYLLSPDQGFLSIKAIWVHSSLPRKKVRD